MLFLMFFFLSYQKWLRLVFPQSLKIAFMLMATLQFGFTAAAAQERLSEPQREALDRIATQDVPKGAPGIATAIIKNAEVIYEKYAGFADLTDSTLIDKSSRFNIASNGKQFTALAVLSLINDNQLALSDDIRKWFPNLYPDIKEPITIQHLLTHTSGIRDCYELWSLQGYTWWKETFSNKDVLQLIKRQTDLNFKPETAYLYSNTNYILLALIIEKVSNKSFAAFTNELFKQLNMPNTSFECDYTQIKGPIAKAYFNFSTWSTYNWIWNVCSDGNLFSTLEDQIQWEKLVQGQGETTFNRTIIAQSQKVIEGSTFKNYGYGLEFGTYKEWNYCFHEGATGAWKATVIRFPEEKIAMITLTNTGKAIPSQQTRQMADVFFELKTQESYLVSEPSSVGDFVDEEEIVGTYLTESDFAFTFENKDGKVFLKRDGRNDVELEREANNIFHQKYDPAFKQEFTTNEKGEMQVTAYYTKHAPYSLTKVGTIENRFDYKKMDGEYLNEETSTSIRIRHQDGTHYEVLFRNTKRAQGLLVSSRKLLVNSYSLEFSDGDILLNGDRIKQLRYKRK